MTVNLNSAFLNRAFENKNDGNFEPRLQKLIMNKNIPYHVKWLGDLNSSLPLKVHFPNIICNKMYSDSMSCEECEKVVAYMGQEKLNTPKTVWAILGYVYDLVGTKFTSKKTGNEYDVSPVAVIEISSGKKGINFENLEQYHNSGLFMDDVWVVKRGEGGIDKPCVADVRLLGKQFNDKIPEDVLTKYLKMPPGEMRGLIFSCYTNTKWNHPDIKEAGIIAPSTVSNSTGDEDPLD